MDRNDYVSIGLLFIILIGLVELIWFIGVDTSTVYNITCFSPKETIIINAYAYKNNGGNYFKPVNNADGIILLPKTDGFYCRTEIVK